MEHLSIEGQTRAEIYRALELLGANHELLATAGSWGDTINDEEALRLLREWNAAEEKLQKTQ